MAQSPTATLKKIKILSFLNVQSDKWIMFKYTLALFTILTNCYSETFTMLGDKDSIVEVKSVDGIKYTNFHQSALALKALKSKKPNLDSKKLIGNPASRNCTLLGGKSIILRDSKNRQYDFCRFQDESMIDSWSLYEKH